MGGFGQHGRGEKGQGKGDECRGKWERGHSCKWICGEGWLGIGAGKEKEKGSVHGVVYASGSA